MAYDFIDLSDIGKINKYDLKGKAKNLGVLLQNRINTPAGFIILKAKLNDLNEQDFLESLFRFFTAYSFDKKRFVCRSSFDYEDGFSNSFAGVFESYLGLSTFEGLLKSIHGVVESQFSERVLTYMKSIQFDQNEGSMSVVVQEMIDSDVSGVCFTVNPLTNYEELYFEYVDGTCEKLVNGEVIPNSIIIRDGIIEAKPLGIEESTFESLVETINKLKLIFQKNIDIEWCIKNNTTYILQVRPITT